MCADSDEACADCGAAVPCDDHDTCWQCGAPLCYDCSRRSHVCLRCGNINTLINLGEEIFK